jgi:HAD superfamily 5'-nucleotidase-like hydrolase
MKKMLIGRARLLIGIPFLRTRCFAQNTALTPKDLWDRYDVKKSEVKKQLENSSVDAEQIFANDELSLKDINVYGFDYDFTLVHYKEELKNLIYDKAKKILVDKMAYPSEIEHLKFNPGFIIKGLHLDKRKGNLMKIDAYHRIQSDSVHRGHNRLKVDKEYTGRHVPLYAMSDYHQMTQMDDHHRYQQSDSHIFIQFLDSFSIPEAALFADVSQHLLQNYNDVDSEYVYIDIKKAVSQVHITDLHSIIVKNPDKYIETNDSIPHLLKHLKDSGKKIFLLTNNRFEYVNEGMCYMFKSNEWRDLFDVIVCSTRKPKFYSDVNRPFRHFDSETLKPTWPKVYTLEPAKKAIYHQGNIKEFVKLTGWKGSEVLYIGDNISSDLTVRILFQSKHKCNFCSNNISKIHTFDHNYYLLLCTCNKLNFVNDK